MEKKQRLLTFIIFLALILLIPFESLAYGFPDEFYAKEYGVQEGLKSAEVNAIAQTDDGYIWVGTYSGLYKFDGLKFSRVLSNEKILSVMTLFNSSDGMLWIGTNDRGAACYDINTRQLRFYTVKNGLGSDSVRCICEDKDGNIYLGTTNSLVRIGKDGTAEPVTEFSTTSYARSLSCTDGGIIIGTTNVGTAFSIEGGDVTDLSPLFREDCFLNSAGAGPDNTALFGTTGNEIYCVDLSDPHPDAGLFSRIGDDSGICAIKKFPGEEQIYIACDKGFGYADSDGTYHPFNLSSFYSSVCDVIEDYQGNLWFASSKQGLVKLSENPFSDPLAKIGCSTVVNSICSYGKAFLIGCDDGLIAIDRESYDPVEFPWLSDFAGERVRNILCDSRNNLWISTYGSKGLVRIAEDQSTVYFSEQFGNAAGNRFRFAKELSDGTVLAASSTGLTFIDIDDAKTLSTLSASDGLTTAQILDFIEAPDGKILAGSDGGGIYIIENRKIAGTISAEHGLDSPVILKIVPCTGGRIYVTSNSLYYDNGTVIRSLDNFPYSNCYDLYITEDRQVWTSSSAGLYVISEADMLADQPGYSCVLLNEYRGLDTTLTANAWNAVTADDTLYLCCSTGIRTISIPAFNSNHNESLIKAYLKKVTADGNDILPDENGTYIISSNTRRITVYPAVLNYSLALPNVRISLEGFDDTGVTYSQMEKSEVSFTNLPHGDYTLRIQILREKDGIVLNDIAVPFKREAAFRETVWYSLLIVGLITAFFTIGTGLIVRTKNLKIIKEQYHQIMEARDEAERANKAKSFFLAKMSHDIRTPINSIMGMNEMIRQETSSDAIRSYSDDIDISGRTLISLVDEILDLSKLESKKVELNLQEYDTAEMLREMYSTLKLRADDKGIEAIGDFSKDLPARLYGDDLKIKEVILNLISNAVKYTEKGSVTLKARVVEETDTEVILGFSIKDTGIGISAKDRKIIFEAYERLTGGNHSLIEGAGLGLNISQRILELMGSELELQSEVGKGSEFSFELVQKKVGSDRVGSDLAAKPAAADKTPETGYVNPEASVLVVDDTPLNLKVVCNLLKKSRVHVDTAACGTECIALVQRNRYNLILLDDMMPDMSGTDTLNWIRSQPNCSFDSPVVVLTANALVGAEEDYLNAGFDGYISKPVSRATLEYVLEKYIGGNNK